MAAEVISSTPNLASSNSKSGRQRRPPANRDFYCGEHTTELLQCLMKMWKEKVLCDGTVIVGGHHFSIHRAVLASCSDYFYAIFSRNDSVRSVELNTSIDKDGLQLLLEYAYTAKITLTAENINTVLSTAVQLQMKRVINMCQQFLKSVLDIENCVSFLRMSSKYNFQELGQSAKNFITNQFIQVSERPEFQRLTADEITYFLSQDRVATRSEFDLFTTAAKWIEYDREARIQFAPQIMQHIRFLLISSKDLVDHVQSHDFMMENEECHRYLLEALNYHLIPQRQHSFNAQKTRMRSTNEMLLSTGGELPNQRVSDRLLLYDEVHARWVHLTSMPLKRVDHSVAVMDHFLFVVGGQVTLNSNGKESIGTVHRYDSRFNSWLQMCPMQQRRAFFHLSATDGFLYAIGGKNEQGPIASCEVYDPSKNKWRYIQSLDKPTYALSGCVLAKKVYVTGGFVNKAFSKSLLMYDFQDGEWIARRPMTTARGFHMSCSVRDYIYSIGGNQLDGMGNRVDVSTVERYDPTIDEWTQINPMFCGLSMAGIGVIDNRRILIIGGYNGLNRNREKNVHQYSICRDEWDIVGELPCPCLRMACCTLVLPPSVLRSESSQSSTDALSTTSATTSSSSRFGSFASTLPVT